MTLMYDCKYCGNSFSQRGVLVRHQRNTRYCLEMQQKQVNYEICQYCNKQVSQKKLTRHYNNCLEYQLRMRTEVLQQEIKILREELEITRKERDELVKIAINKPTKIDNRQSVIFQSLLPVTQEFVQDQAQFLTIEDIKAGADGYARFASKLPFKDRIICTDTARLKLKYKDQDGILIEDPEGLKSSQMFFAAIDSHNREKIDEAYAHIAAQITDPEFIQGNATTVHELLTLANDLMNQREHCSQAARGEDNELRKKFAKKLATLVNIK